MKINSQIERRSVKTRMFQASEETETANRVETTLLLRKSYHKSKVFAVDLIIYANKEEKNCEKIFAHLEILIHNIEYTYVSLLILIKNNRRYSGYIFSKGTYTFPIHFTTLHILRPRNKKNLSRILNPVETLVINVIVSFPSIVLLRS